MENLGEDGKSKEKVASAGVGEEKRSSRAKAAMGFWRSARKDGDRIGGGRAGEGRWNQPSLRGDNRGENT